MRTHIWTAGLRVAALVLLASIGGLCEGQTVIERAARQEARVRAMPLDRRPNRLGHFYGNNVRRIQSGRLLVNVGRVDRPIARFFYLP